MKIDPSLNAAPPRNENAELRRLAHEMEGVFLNQLFQAMRASVPTVSDDPGQELYTSLLDERVASIASQHTERGLGEALYRQLSRRLGHAGPPEATP